jgi:N-sulfoglucosamine sulfohydrolase
VRAAGSPALKGLVMRIVSALLALLSAGVAAAADAPRKNVVLLIADDLGMQLGCYGDRAFQTPNIDALAKAGTRFTHGFASVSSCSPSRATMLTGLPTHQNGQYGLAHATHNFYTFRNVQSLPKLLGDAGYRTAVLAKLHVQPKEVYPWTEEIPAGGGRNVDAIARAAKKFIQAGGDKPFFLHVGYTDPHRAAKGFANDKNDPNAPAVKYDPKDVTVPYHLSDQPEVRAELAEFYESVSRLDRGVGLMLEVLKETGNADNTLIIFLSDNGIPFPGAKTTLYDAGVHLPLIVKSPAQTKAGAVCDAMASWTDLAPTILDWAGVKTPKEMRGRSLLPVLDVEKTKGWDVVYGSHQFHEVTMYYPMRMVRTRKHKYILNLAHLLPYPFASDLYNSDSWQGALKRGDKMLGSRNREAFEHRPKEELYDLTADPNELKNLADDPKSAVVVKDLRARLRSWQEATKDPWLVKYTYE